MFIPSFLSLFVYVLYLLARVRAQRRILQALVFHILNFAQLKWPHNKKYLQKMQRRRRRTRPYNQKRLLPRNQGDILAVNTHERTGLFEHQFEEVYQSIKDTLKRPRGSQGTRNTVVSLSPRFRLLLVLHWLRRNLHYRTLALIYFVSPATISREVGHILPKLYLKLNYIHLPLQLPAHTFEGVSAAIDCSSHFRPRVHPRQADWYRWDKHAFFISAQVVVSLTGELLSVTLGMGHNNDQGMFNMEMKEFLRQHAMKWLADGGYSNDHLVTPDEHMPAEWNQTQKMLRSIVEVVIGFVKLYLFTAQRVRVNPELQEIAILVCYQLTQIVLRDFPIKIHLMYKCTFILLHHSARKAALRFETKNHSVARRCTEVCAIFLRLRSPH